MGTTESNEIVIRHLTNDDLPFAMELKSIVRWNQTKADWEFFLDFEPEGCFLAESSGQRAATALAVSYEQTSGWIAMIIVHPSHRKKGIGKALLKKCIHYLLDLGVTTIKLDATAAGKPLYASFGFKDQYIVNRYEGIVTTDKVISSSKVRSITLEDEIHCIAEFDKTYFGVSRKKVLTRLISENNDLSFLYRDETGKVAGYIVCRRGSNCYHIGPWIAQSSKVAEDLLVKILQKLKGESIIVDVPEPNKNAALLLQRYSFKLSRSFVRMALGEQIVIEDAVGIYSTSGPEKG